MRFYSKQHEFYLGIDLHAREMYLCVLDQAGEVRFHRNMPADPEHLERAISPFVEDIVIGADLLT